MIKAIRGAITVESNTTDAIKEATVELFQEILTSNSLIPSDIAYMIFTATKDLTKAYPAKFIRTELNITDIPMMCEQEMNVDGSLEMAIRVLVVLADCDAEKKINHVYLKGAKKLRPDLSLS